MPFYVILEVAFTANHMTDILQTQQRQNT